MPGGFLKFWLPVLAAALLAGVPEASSAVACAERSRPASATARIAAVSVPSAPLLVRIGPRRPACGQLLVMPRSGVRVLARPGASLRVIRRGRPALTLRPGRRVVHIVAIHRSNRIVVRWRGKRVRIAALVRPERRVVTRRGVAALRRTAASPGTGASPGTATPGGSPATPSSPPRPVTGGVTPSGPAAPPSPGSIPLRMFAADSPWYARVDSRPLAGGGAAVSEDLRDQARRTGTWMNIDEWSVPIHVVGPDTPLVAVVDSDDGEMNRAGAWSWGRVPLPATARAAGPHPGDNHLVVWQPSSDTMWEFWGFRRVNGRPHSPHGARIANVSRSDGTIPSPWGAAASGIAMAAGLVTGRDVARGRIDHALVIGIPEIRPGVHQPPATRTDGYVDRATAPVMGMRFRLDPALDVASLGLPPLVRMLAEAAQRHGMVVRDTAGSVSFYAEDPISIGHDPFTPLLGGVERGEAMRMFPWEHVQLVAP